MTVLKQLQGTTVTKETGGVLYTTDYDYKQISGRQTPLIEQREVLANGDVVSGQRYSYDALGNILGIYESELIEGNQYRRPLAIYTYGDQNQLLTETIYTYEEDDTETTVYSYTYDTAGNILTESKNGTVTKTYTYGNSQWNDLLTAFNGTAITYDGSGNPLNYVNGQRSYTNLTWQHGRDLTSVTVGGATSTYAYDMNGIRTRKTVNGVMHTYVTQNGKVVRETIGSGTTAQILDFIYDESGKPFALVYTNGAADPVNYYYVLNLQGDVVGLLDETGEEIAVYTYTAWGEILSVTNANGTAITSSTHIANLNPLRYRGYYYDTETGFYYLQSRYYDPASHRFINADSYTSTDTTDAISCNMFAYCGNNPVIYGDDEGTDAVIVIDNNAAAGAGHIGFLVQDEEGNWFHFYWGPYGDGGTTYCAITVSCVYPETWCKAYEGELSLSAINASGQYSGTYDEMIYLEGDFSESAEKTKKHLYGRKDFTI